MPQIKFYANVKPETTVDSNGNILTSDTTNEIDHAAGSGLGFYGNGFRVSVAVGSQQDQTYVTNALGTSQGVRLNNTAMASAGDTTTQGTVAVNGGQPVNLGDLPNMACPLNIRFTHTGGTAVRTQNCKLRIFDRNGTIDDPAKEVTTYVYEARHPSNSETVDQLEHRAYATDNKWVEFDSSDTTVADMELTSSPGINGTNSGGENNTTQSAKGWATNEGPSRQDVQHDWFVALSSMPDAIGSKTDYALYVTMEYLE
jgi:hypothetical protein